MHQYAIIKAYKETEDGTMLQVLIPKKSIREHLKRFQRGGIVETEIRLDDPRYISSKQRKAIYATINDISYWYGEVPEYLKELLKAYYIIEKDRKHFSLSNCSVTEARMFIDYLLEFALKHDIALAESGLERTDDIDRYLWMCLKYRKCCICGTPGELHHCTGSRIGMGNNRRKASNTGRELISLCRKHHTEIHQKPESEFFKKYNVHGILFQEAGEEEHE